MTTIVRQAGSAAASGEIIRDTIAAALVAGANVTITPNDGADTITIAAATSGSVGIPAAIVDAKGDLIGGTGNDTVARLGIGTDGQVLTATSANTTGLGWTTPATDLVHRVIYSGSAYPARPTGVTAGFVEYVGPTQPTDWLVGDTWTQV